MHSAKKAVVGTTAVKLFEFREGFQSKKSSVIVRPKDGTIYVGAENVTVEDGFPVGPGDTFTMDIDADLFGIAGGDTVTVNGIIQR